MASRILLVFGILLGGAGFARAIQQPALVLNLAPPGISNEFAATPELTWDAEAGVTYVVQTSTNLADPAAWRDTEVAVKSSVGPLKWMAPESLQGTKYYRLVTQAAVYDVQPAFVNSGDTNALLYIFGQLLPSNAIVVINGQNFAATSVSNGVWSVNLNGLPPGTPITGTISVLDGGTSNVVATLPVQSPIYYGTNLTAELLQEPPELPPASPQALGIAIFASKKGYDYYQAQSAMGAFLSKKGYDYYKASSDRAAYASKKGYDYWKARSDLGVFLSKKGYDYYQAQSALQQTGSAKRGYDYYQVQSQKTSAGAHNNPYFVEGNNQGEMVSMVGDLKDDDCNGGVDAPSGEFRLKQTDLAIPGAMLNFAWMRTYRSRTGPTTAQGAGWDFSYNVSLTQNGDGTITLHPGNGRADTFYPDGTNGWFRDEYFCQIIDLNSDSCPDVLFADGSRWMFNPLATGGTISLAQIIDRNGNTTALNYDGFGRLAEIVDDLGRTNTVAYGSSGQIESVSDFTGRTVRYEYDTNGDLTAVISPPTSDFPGGITNRYTYSSGYANAAENHLLESVINGKGQVTHQHIFQHNQTDLDFLRCISTQSGTNPPVQFTYLPAVPALSNNFAIAKIIICDAVGNLKECFCDSRGRCVRELDYTGRCDPNLPVTETENRPTGKLRVDDPDYYETKWTWNADSLCTSVTCPDGTCAEYTYQRAFNQNASRSNHSHSGLIDDRLHNGDLRVVRELAAPGGGADLDGDGVNDITELAWHFEYDPRFGSPVGETAASGDVFVLEAIKRIGSTASRFIHPGTGVNTGINEPTPDTMLHNTRTRINPLEERLKALGLLAPANANIFNETKWEKVDNSDLDVQAGIVAGGVRGNGIRDFQVGEVCDGFITSSTDPRGNVTTAGYDAKGNPVTLQHSGYLLDGADVPLVAFAYNNQGQLTAITNAADANGYRGVDTISYYSSGAQTGWPASIAIDEQGVHLTSTFEYDSVGNLTRYVDPRTNDWLFTYDALNRCVSSQTPENVFGSRTTSTFTYDANGNLVQSSTGLIDETGVFQHDVVSTAEYDALDRCTALAEQVSPGVLVTNRFTYDANSQLTLAESPLAVSGADTHATVAYEYDERGLLFREIGAPGSGNSPTNEYSYNSIGQLRLKLGTANSGIERPGTGFTYDGLGRLATMTDAMSNVVSHVYDRNGNCTLVRCYGETNDVPGSAGNRLLAETRFSYDGLDRCVQQVDSFFDIFTLVPVGKGTATTTFAYSPNGDCTSVTDDNGHATAFGYDTAGRLKSVSAPGCNCVCSPGFSGPSKIICTNYPDGGGAPQVFSTEFAYDALSRCIANWDNVGNTNRYEYDSLGRLARETNPRGVPTAVEYDDLGRGLKLWVDKDGDGTIQPGELDGVHVFNANSQLVSVTDANTNTTSYAYDSLGNCIHVMNGDGTVIQLIWSPRSNLISVEDANGTTITNTYDLRDRIVHRDIACRNVVAATTTFEDFGYDGLSRCVSAVNDSSACAFAYDSMGNCVSSDQDGRVTTATFDGVGNCLSITYPSTRVVSYAYDANDQVSAISTGTGGGSTQLATFSYAGPGRLEKISRANGVDTLFQWDGKIGQGNASGDYGWQQISGVSHQSVSGAVILDRRACAYDRNQNKISRTQLAPFVAGQDSATNLWGYDGMNRLIESALLRDSSLATKSYNLDANGNRLTVTNNSVPENYFMDATLPSPGDFQMNQYTTTPFGSQMFDDNGNLVARGAASGAFQYVYDYADRLVAVTNLSFGTLAAAYEYDALGRRISKTVYPDGQPPVTMDYLHIQPLGGNILIHCDRSLGETYVGTTLIDSMLNLPDDGLRVCRIPNGAAPEYFHQDDVGNVLALTDGSGSVIERYDYDDFGQPSFLSSNGIPLTDGNGLPAIESSVGNPFLFHGMKWDGETGFYSADRRWASDPYVEDYMRSYDPQTGQAISRNQPVRCWDNHCRTAFGGNPWTMLKEEGGRHTPFNNRRTLYEKFLNGDIPNQDDFTSVKRADVTVEKFQFRQEFGPTQGR